MADELWNELQLQVRFDDLQGIPTPQLIPSVDGSVLGLGLDTRADSATAGLGMDPTELLGRDTPLLPPKLGGVHELIGEKPALAIVWRCSCGEPGDASIGLRVHREIDPATRKWGVVWDDWRIRFGNPPPTCRESYGSTPAPTMPS